jgi:hypothetical protein
MQGTRTKDLRAIFLVLSFLGVALLLACSFGCGGPAASSDSGQGPAGDVPELTDDMIRDRINYAYVRNITEENGTGEPMNWTFMHEEPKEISIVDKQIQGDHATVVLDIKTRSGPRARGPRALAGQIRTEWQLRTGWVLRQWEIVDTENISMKYTKLPTAPSLDNSNSAKPDDELEPPKPPRPNYSNR